VLEGDKMKFDKDTVLHLIFRLFIVITANTLLAFTTVWFLEPAKLYSGGATGTAQLIKRLFERGNMLTDVNLGWFIFAVNIPITIVGIKFVSKKFAFYSVIAVLVQTVATLLIPKSPFSELQTAVSTAMQNGEQIGIELYGGMLTLAICGGVLAGIASGIALKYGTSTGGLDVVAQALALKKNISIGIFTTSLNVIIAIVGGAILQGSWIIALFTIIRMVLNGLVIDKIHTSYTYTALHIFSKHSYEIAREIMDTLHRGCTYENVTGAYSGESEVEVYCVLSTYEVEKALKIIRRLDSSAFVTLSPVKGINGRFIKNSIV